MLIHGLPIEIIVQNVSDFNVRDAAGWTYLTDKDTPCTATIGVLSENGDSVTASFGAIVTKIAGGEMLLVSSAAERINRPSISAQVLLYKSDRGEAVLQISAMILRSIRSGEICRHTAKITTLFRSFISVERIFAEYVATHSPTGWNKWYEQLSGGVRLCGLNCRGMNLSYFDLCSATLENCDLRNCNLSNTNLAGADLSQCRLEGVIIEGADLFNATINKRYEPLILASGLLERESVTLL